MNKMMYLKKIKLNGATIAWGLPPYVPYPDALINSAVECGRPHAIVAPTEQRKESKTFLKIKTFLAQKPFHYVLKKQ